MESKKNEHTCKQYIDSVYGERSGMVAKVYTDSYGLTHCNECGAWLRKNNGGSLPARCPFCLRAIDATFDALLPSESRENQGGKTR